MKRWTDFISYLFLRLLILPPPCFYRLLLRPVATLVSSDLATRNIYPLQRVLENLEIAFPEKSIREKRLLLRQIVWHTVLGLYESGHMYRRAWVNRAVTVEGLPHLDQALGKGKGVVFLSGHLGSFTLILSYLKTNGYPIRNIGRDPGNPYLAGYFERIRQRVGVRHIPRSPLALSIKESLSWLKAGKILSLPSDQYTKSGVAVPFFGRDVLTPTGPAVFARRTGCAVLPVSIVRRGEKHLIRIEPEMNLRYSENQEEDIKNNTALFNRVMERCIRDDPDQWFGWFTRRFR